MGACLSNSSAEEIPQGRAPERRSSYAKRASTSEGAGKAAWSVVWAGTFTIGAERGAGAVAAGVNMLEAQETTNDVAATVRMDSHSLRVLENEHGNNVETHFIRSISSVATHGDGGMKFVGLVCKHPTLGIRTCTLFKCGDGTADDMTRSIQDVFQELIKVGNPFAAPDGQDLIRPPETLANEEIRRHFLTSAGVVGAGQFGEVHLAKLNLKYGTPRHKSEEGHIMVAVKMLKLSAPAEDRTEFVRECEAMLLLNHPNLLTMHGVSVRRRPWLCIVELIAYGDMLSIVKASKTKDIELSYPEQIRIFAQAAEGMAHMARSGYVHMDLAARNLLLGKGLVCKVADFGLTRSVDPQSKMFVQTELMKVPMKWMSPESMDDRLWSEKSDVWSFGVAMWEIVTYGEVPFGQFVNKDVQGKVRAGLRLEQPEECPDEMYALMMRCWEKNYDARLTFQTLSDTLHRMLEKLEHVRQQMPERDVGALLAGVPEKKPVFYGKSVPKGVPVPNYGAAPTSTIVVNPAFRSPQKAENMSKTKKAGKKKKKKESTTTPDTNTAASADGLTESDVGCHVRVAGVGEDGVLRFVGPHHESGSERYGIEFQNPVGKNNGTVKGHVYFVCKKNHGQLCVPKKVSRANGPLAGRPCVGRGARAIVKKNPKPAMATPGDGGGTVDNRRLSLVAGSTTPALPAATTHGGGGDEWTGASTALAAASSGNVEENDDMMDRMMAEMGMPVGDSADA